MKKNAKAPLIKVCGLTSQRDAELAASLGADFCGFVFHPGSPRAVSAEQVRMMPTSGAKRVGVFVDHSLAESQDIMGRACLDLAQLHGDQAIELAMALGPARIIKVFWPERQPRDELLLAMDLWKEFSALFLFDSGTGGGGHGRGIMADIPQSPKPYLLAGGLGPAEARASWPSKDPMLQGFDLNSGLESSPGQKDCQALGELLPWRRGLAQRRALGPLS